MTQSITIVFNRIKNVDLDNQKPPPLLLVVVVVVVAMIIKRQI